MNAVDAHSKTALHYLAKIFWADDLDDKVNAIRLFASYNADKTILDEEGLTALDTFHRSCRDDDKEKDPDSYAEIERLLTPEKTDQTPQTEQISKQEQSEEVKIAKHTPLPDISDDW